MKICHDRTALLAGLEQRLNQRYLAAQVGHDRLFGPTREDFEGREDAFDAAWEAWGRASDRATATERSVRRVDLGMPLWKARPYLIAASIQVLREEDRQRVAAGLPPINRSALRQLEDPEGFEADIEAHVARHRDNALPTAA